MPWSAHGDTTEQINPIHVGDLFRQRRRGNQPRLGSRPGCYSTGNRRHISQEGNDRNLGLATPGILFVPIRPGDPASSCLRPGRTWTTPGASLGTANQTPGEVCQDDLANIIQTAGRARRCIQFADRLFYCCWGCRYWNLTTARARIATAVLPIHRLSPLQGRGWSTP